MSQTVQLEDGSIHEFPDDATQDEMLAALPPAPPQLGALENFGNAAQKGYTNLGLGLLSAGNNIGDVTGAIPSDVAAQNRQIFGDTKQQVNDVLPTQPGASRWLGNMIGANAPALLAPGGPLVAGAAFGATDALSSEDPTKMTPGAQALDVGTTSALYGLGSKAADMALKGAIGLGGKTYNYITGEVSPIIKAYQEAGVTPRLTGDVTGSPTMQLIQNIASKFPLGANQVEDAASKTLDEFGNSVENTADKMGTSHTLQEAGQTVQDTFKKWLVGAQKDTTDQWNLVDDSMGKNAPVPATNLMKGINTLTQAAQGNEALASTIQSPIMQKAISILKENNGRPLSWEQTRALRTYIGQNLENPMLISGPEQAQSKLLYGALTKDMQQAVFSYGKGSAIKAFQQANQATSNMHNYIDLMKPYMNVTPEAAASQLLSSGTKGGTALQALRETQPEAADELGAVSLRRMGAGQSEGSAGNTVSPSRWLSNQDPVRRLAPEAKNALFPSSLVQSKMNALDIVANSMKASEKFANPSGTGGHLGTMMALSAPFEGAIAGAATGGAHGAMLGTLAGSVPGVLGAGSGLISTTPALARFLATPTPNIPFSFAPSITSMIRP